MSAFHFAVLGDPVAHSRSPAIHNAALKSLGLEGSYEARRAGPSELAAAIVEMRSGALDGINVTMPLKQAAADSADLLSAAAASAESVNSMRFRDGAIEGETTDAVAMTLVLAKPEIPQAAPILILGAGGAAAAVAQASPGREVIISARDPERARQRFENLVAGGAIAVAPFGASVRGAVLVNATPIGMMGEELPAGMVEESAALIDLAYGPRVSPSVERARGLGLPVVDGVEFLTLQAAASFTWWTGIEAPHAVMLEAARNG
jgi:shikimate dehydrogenase